MNEDQKVTPTVRYVPRSIEFLFYVVATLTLGSLGYLWLAEAPVVVAERVVVTPIVVPGDRVIIRNRILVKADCDIFVKRTLVDAIGVAHQLVLDNGTPLQLEPGPSIYTVSFIVPKQVATGKSYYHTEITWSCNTLQELFPTTYSLEPLEITVTSGE
jgi:hypothetical protein